MPGHGARQARTVVAVSRCVHPGDERGSDGFWDLVLFIPSFKEKHDTPDPTDYEATWGTWVAQSFVTPQVWTSDEDYDEGDLAASTVKAPSASRILPRLKMNCDMGKGASGGPMATTEHFLARARSGR